MITIDPDLLQNVAQAMRRPYHEQNSQSIDGVGVAADIVGIGGAVISSGPRPLAWLELNGYVNLCPENHVVVSGRRYIYDRAELIKAVDEMNSTQPIIVATGTQMDAAIATGLIPSSLRPAKPQVDMAAFRSAFGVE